MRLKVQKHQELSTKVKLKSFGWSILSPRVDHGYHDSTMCIRLPMAYGLTIKNDTQFIRYTLLSTKCRLKEFIKR